jgi:N-acetyl-beta-hexosaminidase
MLLLNHFTEKFDPASCKGTCDNCASTDEVTDIELTTSAIQFVKMIQELENRCMKITGALSLHAFRGTSKHDMARRKFDTVDHFGKGSDLSTDLAKRLFDHLVAREILATELEEAQVANRAPISYVYVLTFFLTSAMLRLTRLLAARVQGKGVSYEQAIVHLDYSLRKERRSEVQEGFTVAGADPCTHNLD